MGSPAHTEHGTPSFGVPLARRHRLSGAHDCSLWCLRLQLCMPTVGASHAYGCSLACPTVAAWQAYGCSPACLRLQPGMPTVAGETEKLSAPFTIDALLARWEGAALTRKDATNYLDMMCQVTGCAWRVRGVCVVRGAWA